MRNEIYEKISQSRKRYLAELNQKNHQNEVPEEKPLEPFKKPKSKSKADIESMNFQLMEYWRSVEPNWGISAKLKEAFQRTRFEGFNEKLGKLATGLKRKLRKANQRFSSSSDKFVESFVIYSNRIFEDRYESVDPEKPDMNGLTLQTASSRQMVWEFEDTCKDQEFLPPFSESQLGYFLKKIENTFIKTWKHFRFSIEFDGASLEYVDEVGIEPMYDEGKKIDFVQISKAKDTIPIVSMRDDIGDQAKENGRNFQNGLSGLRRTKQFFKKTEHSLFSTGEKIMGQLWLDRSIGSVLKPPLKIVHKKSPATRLQGLKS